MEDDEFIKELSENALYDISDIKSTFHHTKGNCSIHLILKSQTPINIMRYYLWMKQYIFDVETSLGILEEAPEEH